MEHTATILTKEDILKANDIQIITFPVPEWNGEINLKEMNAYERDLFEEMIMGNEDSMKNLRVCVLTMCICDAEGNRFFDEKSIEELNKKSSLVVIKIFDKCKEINHILQAPAQREAQVEDAEKNLGNDQDASFNGEQL